MSAAPDSAVREPRNAAARHMWTWDLLAWAGLAVAVLVMLWPLGLTNRVLAGLDAFTYFQPYWAYRSTALSAGRLPLWNPYLFLGVPFLANPQAAVLYPLHWPLTWLPAERALVWSAILHVWLAAGFTYTFARRSFHVTRPAAWLTGLLYGMGGFALARIENVNQLNTMAWLPAMLWLYDETVHASTWRRGLRWGTGLVVVIAVQFLAGHTQTAFVNVVGLGLYAVYAPARWVFWRLRRSASQETQSDPMPAEGEPLQSRGVGRAGPKSGQVLLRALLPLLAVLPALLLVAAQLLPSLELNRLGLRTAGLPFRQAVSFSLRPRLLAQSLLPPFGGGLADAFGSEGYAEFVTYVGITGLVLAALAVSQLARSRGTLPHNRPTHSGAGTTSAAPGALLLLALSGLFLALGAYNPLYYLLWRLVPGFDLFRAPVRWFELAAIGLATLAGLGLDEAGQLASIRGDHKEMHGQAQQRFSPRPAGLILATLLVAGIAVLLAYQQWPGTQTVLMWLTVAALAVGGVRAGKRWPRAARAGLLALATLELWLAGRALPFTAATAPYVLSLRSAPAALLAEVGDLFPAGSERFLSMSDIRYDPGDLTELRELMAGSLPADAVERLVRGAKQTEVIAPNLSLRLQLPAVDGYDGGLLPTQDYGKLQTLFLPDDQRLPDGRMREQLHQIPPGRLLDLTGVRFVLTDKQNDLWAEDVYYDLEQSVTLEPGEALDIDLQNYPRFSATALGFVSHLNGVAGDGTVAAEIEVRSGDGQTINLPVRAGKETATGTGPAGDVRVARAWPDWTGAQGQDYLATLELVEPLAPTGITVRVPADAPGEFVLQGLSLVDRRTGTHASVTVSQKGDFRRIHTGDVKIYERTQAPGRAWLVHGLQPAANGDAALRMLADPAFDPKQSVVIEGELTPQPPSAQQDGEVVKITEFGPERVRLDAEVTRPAVLVLADAFYPGWQATVDGAPAPILRGNLMFRAVALTPGSHQVSFSYEPTAWHWGMVVSLAALVLVAGAFLATFLPARQKGSLAV
jgi:hypothetical protein